MFSKFLAVTTSTADRSYLIFSTVPESLTISLNSLSCSDLLTSALCSRALSIDILSSCCIFIFFISSLMGDNFSSSKSLNALEEKQAM